MPGQIQRVLIELFNRNPFEFHWRIRSAWIIPAGLDLIMKFEADGDSINPYTLLYYYGRNQSENRSDICNWFDSVSNLMTNGDWNGGSTANHEQIETNSNAISMLQFQSSNVHGLLSINWANQTKILLLLLLSSS